MDVFDFGSAQQPLPSPIILAIARLSRAIVGTPLWAAKGRTRDTRLYISVRLAAISRLAILLLVVARPQHHADWTASRRAQSKPW